MMNWSMLVCASAAVLLAVAALHDLAVRTVPNALTGIIAVCGLWLALIQHRFLPSIGVSALLLGLSAILWLRGYMGGADAKLLAATGMLVTPGDVPTMLLATVLAGGLLCLPYLPGGRLFARPVPGRPRTVPARLLRCERWRLRRHGPLPYAVAIAAGTLFVLLQGA